MCFGGWTVFIQWKWRLQNTIWTNYSQFFSWLGMNWRLLIWSDFIQFVIYVLYKRKMYLGTDKYVLVFMHKIVFHKKTTDENKIKNSLCLYRVNCRGVESSHVTWTWVNNQIDLTWLHLSWVTWSPLQTLKFKWFY